jgi:hypothetical protein
LEIDPPFTDHASNRMDATGTRNPRPRATGNRRRGG